MGQLVRVALGCGVEAAALLVGQKGQGWFWGVRPPMVGELCPFPLVFSQPCRDHPREKVEMGPDGWAEQEPRGVAGQCLGDAWRLGGTMRAGSALGFWGSRSWMLLRGQESVKASPAPLAIAVQLETRAGVNWATVGTP